MRLVALWYVESSRTRDWTHVSCIGRQILYPWATREAQFNSFVLICGWVNTLATSCEELTHWKRPWCWEGLGAGEEGDDRGWNGWMASPTRHTWVWVNSGCWWWTESPGVLQFMGSQRVGHDRVTELNWTEGNLRYFLSFVLTNWAFPLSLLNRNWTGVMEWDAKIWT